ncbi:MAG: effector-associated domain EAD1-containing protein, partial [Trichodesmium sp. St16_bin4-tuft]|nr:effector-associated domain EAD1-containing protein [Trichodesmium sp. St16_bin4-tuft]
MNLSKSERKYLFKALEDGYRSYDQLRMMFKLNLEKNLEEIVKRDPLDNVILALIEWAESQNKLLDLVWGAND